MQTCTWKILLLKGAVRDIQLIRLEEQQMLLCTEVVKS